MKSLLSILSASFFIFNTMYINNNIENTSPKIIDAYLLAYDAMYNQPENFKVDYIILDMPSY